MFSLIYAGINGWVHNPRSLWRHCNGFPYFTGDRVEQNPPYSLWETYSYWYIKHNQLHNSSSIARGKIQYHNGDNNRICNACIRKRFTLKTGIRPNHYIGITWGLMVLQVKGNWTVFQQLIQANNKNIKALWVEPPEEDRRIPLTKGQ